MCICTRRERIYCASPHASLFTLRGSTMQDMRFSERVLLNRERFTDFEETFSLYVLANPEEASSRTISDLAHAFHISPNAIMRFSHKLGYEGFSDMRLSLGRDAAMAKDNTKPTSTQRLVDKTLSLCENTSAQDQAAHLIASARRVAFFAVGETAYIVHAFANRMTDFDEKTHFMTYENQIRRELEHGDGLVLVLVSLSGETAQVVNFAREAWRRSVPTVTLTDLHPCTLTQYATVALYCCSPTRRIGDITVTDLTPLAAALTSLEHSYLREIGVVE